jgi:hypothetical protein
LELLGLKEYHHQLAKLCKTGSPEDVEKLFIEFNELNQGIENATNCLYLDSCFLNALNHQNFEVAAYLIQNGLETSILKYAIYSEVHSQVEALGFGIYGVVDDDPTVEFDFLLQQGSDIKYLDEAGCTPLDFAVDYPKAEAWLLKVGAKRGHELTGKEPLK